MPKPRAAGRPTAVSRAWQSLGLSGGDDPSLPRVSIVCCSRAVSLCPQVSAQAVASGPASHQRGDHIPQRSQVGSAADGGQVRPSDGPSVSWEVFGAPDDPCISGASAGAADKDIGCQAWGSSSSQGWGPKERGDSKQNSALTRLCLSSVSSRGVHLTSSRR